jgi:integrase
MSKYDKHKLSDTLTIYRRSDSTSDNFHVDIKLPRGNANKGTRTEYARKSLNTDVLENAKLRAVEEELQIKFRIQYKIPVQTKPFEKAYREWLETALNFKTKSRREHHKRVGELYFFEYFNQRDLSTLDELYIEGYWQYRMNVNAERDAAGTLHPNAKLKPAASTLYIEKDSLSQFLKWAAKRNLVRRKFDIEMPIKNERRRRPTFSLPEYKTLLRSSRKWANGVDSYVQSEQFYQRHLIRTAFKFCCESGLRPRELFMLRWKDITYFVDEDGTNQMLISVSPQTKTQGRDCVPMPQAILTLRQWKNGLKTPNGNTQELARYTEQEDFVFANWWGEQFKTHERSVKKMFEHAGLELNNHDEVRTFYAGRHLYATFRLLYGVNIDAFRLAKNMGTSVEMIEKHYGQVTNIQNAVLLTSKRKARKSIYDRDVLQENIIPFPKQA